jgi:hypothetical protein
MIVNPVGYADTIENTGILTYLTFLENVAHLPHYLLDNAYSRLYR